MLVAPFTLDEESRLEALLRYRILDTENEGPYNDLVELASHICGKPIALVSLVDRDRQWFKARVGLDAQETPRDLAFCAHAILQSDVMVVPDATQDERFKENPLVTSEPYIRFYAGAPLITHDGYALGTLCVIDREPGNLTAQQRQALQALARQVISQLELRLQSSRLKQLNQQKEAFIKLLSHDLKSTFNTVLGFSRLLVQRGDALSREKSADYIQRVHRSGLQGWHLLNNLLSWSQLQGASALRSDRFNAHEMCQAVLDYLSEQSHLKQVELSLECSKTLTLQSDEKLLGSVLQNLLHNALKFSYPGSEVRLTVQEQDDDIQFLVTDEGVGMEQEKAEQLFAQGKESTTGTEGEAGTGVGSELIKDFVRASDSTIQAWSSPGKGTRVALTLPQSSR